MEFISRRHPAIAPRNVGQVDFALSLVRHSRKTCDVTLTPCVAVEQEGVLELEVQFFGDGLGQVLHAESVHDGEAVCGRCQPKKKKKKSLLCS